MSIILNLKGHNKISMKNMIFKKRFFSLIKKLQLECDIIDFKNMVVAIFAHIRPNWATMECLPTFIG